LAFGSTHSTSQIDWAPLNWGWARITPFVVVVVVVVVFRQSHPVCSLDRERRNHRLVVCVSVPAEN
jgi:hypothetical protein